MRDTDAASSRAMSIPFAVARSVPPSLWIATMYASLPARRASSASRCATTCSHPSATTMTAPTFGWRQYAASVSWVSARSGPSCPHPARCGSAAPTGAIDAAMRSATTAEQMTVGTTST